MKPLAAVTMVWRDYWYLEKWVAYYTTQLGPENVYILSHGADPEIDRIGQGCNVIAILRDGLHQSFDYARWRMLSDFSAMLTQFYDRVIVADCDELLVTADGSALLDYKFDFQENVAGAVGFNLVATQGSDQETLFSSDKFCLLEVPHSKPSVVQRRVSFGTGGHGVMNDSFDLLPGLFNLHFHYGNLQEVQRREDERVPLVDDATADGVSIPVTPGQSVGIVGWRRRMYRHIRLARDVKRSPEFPMEECVEMCRRDALRTLKTLDDGYFTHDRREDVTFRKFRFPEEFPIKL
ncbi:glycosyltransferase family 2 protein [Ruegeria lacuscaerulensis]|uniref:glycosyltransferase family 2 protein n=1 Tax=Ruegeria lacuscaerulensis TaxID=55218 RepID=UPI001479EA0D|nr:glycosyltransferase family 2 protein [Ruegeria lacuscaerulensis]